MRRLAAALAVLVASLLLAACGDAGGGGESTTTVTASETGSTTSATEQSAASASSDAAGAVPGSDSSVLGASAEPETATPAAPSSSGGEVANDGAVSTDPSTGQPLASTTGTASATAPPPSAATPAPAVASSTTGGMLSRPFASSSPWNTQVAGDPVDPQSRQLMRRASLRVATVEEPNGRISQEQRRIDVGLTVNVTQWTDPVFSDNQPGAVSRITVCRQLDCGPDATSSITIPPDACPAPQYDGWMTALDTNARIGYDFWRARCEADGSLSYHYVKAWDLDGPGFQEPTGVSARGSGLPLFAGLITPEEIDAGRIEHALAISVPGAAQRKYVQPASRTDGTGALNSLPEGARLRLRGGGEKLLTRTFVRNGTQRRAATTIIDALERYGAIVVDRSAAPTLYAQKNADWMGVLPLNLIQDIRLGRFDVVELDQILFDPPRFGEESELPSGTPGSIPGTGSGSQGASGPGGTSFP